MLGAIIGDIVGSHFEFNNTNLLEFELYDPTCRFTDDSICTSGIAKAILDGTYMGETLWKWCHTHYPDP